MEIPNEFAMIRMRYQCVIFEVGKSTGSRENIPAIWLVEAS
jgi:hypothetical protein